MKTKSLPRFARLCHPAFLRLFLNIWRQLKHDPRCSVRNLVKASRLATGEDKIIRHDGKLVYSSFLPPIPTKAAGQVMRAMDTDGKGLFDAMITGKRTAPLSMYIAVTERCPYHCAHCSAVGRRHAPDMTTEELKKLLRELQDMGTAIIGLTGGEPLLRNDLCDLLVAIDDRSVSFLFTSGIGLTREKAAALKAAGLFATGISLDHADPAAMDAQRGCPGAFDHAVNAVKHSRAAGLYTMTQTLADRDALLSGRLLDLVKFSGDIGAHEVRILETMPTGRLARIAPDRLMTPADRAELLRFHAAANRLKHLPKVSVFAHTEDASRFGCGAGTQHSYIDATGNLYPCDFVPLAFGNIRETPVAALWQDMHHAIGKPRQTCMLMELHAKKLFSEASAFPIAPNDAKAIIAKLDTMNTMPGFYQQLTEKK